MRNALISTCLFALGLLAGCAGPGGTRSPARDADSAAAVYADALDVLSAGLSGEASPAARAEAIRMLDGLAQQAGRPGAEAQRVALARVLAARIGPDSPLDVRVRCIRELQMIGGAESVPALRAALADADPLVRETARRALSANPDRRASEALRGSGPAQITPPTGRAALDEADALAASGKRAEAGRICESVVGSADSALLRRAALLTWLCVDPAGARPRILAALSAPTDADVRPRLIAALVDVPGAAFGDAAGDALRRAVADGFSQLAPADQVAALGVFADRRDTVHRAIAVAAANAENADVRLAALRALRQIGDASAIDVLLRRAAGPGGAERDAARTALAALPATGVDDGLVGAFEGAAPAVRRELLRALSVRHAKAKLGVFRARCDDEDDDVRAAAIDGLAALGGRAELDFLLARLGNAPGESTQTALLKAIVALAAPLGDADQRVAYLRGRIDAGAPPAAEANAVRLAARFGGADALKFIRERRANQAPEVADAVVRALSEWPTDAVTPDLLELAQKAADETQRKLALRAVVRLCGQVTTPESERLARLDSMLGLPGADSDDRKAALGVLGGFRTRDALKRIERLGQDSALQSEALTAQVGVLRGLALQDREAVRGDLARLRAAHSGAAGAKQIDEALKFLDDLEDALTSWECAGPFPVDPGSKLVLLEQPFAPESAANEVKWRTLGCADASSPGKFDLTLDDALRGDQRCVYVRTQVWVEKGSSARLDLGSDDGIKAWLNGKLVHTNDAARGYSPASDKVSVQLREGWNDLQLKISNVDGGWAFGASLRSPTGAPLAGLRQRTPQSP